MFIVLVFFSFKASSLAAIGTMWISVRFGGLMIFVESYKRSPPGFTEPSNFSSDGWFNAMTVSKVETMGS